MEPWVTLLVGLALGLVLGAMGSWVLAQRHQERLRAADPLAAELRRQVATQETALEESRRRASEAEQALASARAAREAAERLLGEQRELHERQLEAARLAQEKALADLREAFKALSADALRQTQPEFLRLAAETLGRFQETAKGDLAQRQQAIAGLLEPLKQQLETYQRRLQQSETSQAQALGEVNQHLQTLTQQSQSLSQETLQLRRVLSSSQARGRWGEETLRRVVEAAGMSAHCDFTEQVVSGDSKPDLVVRLPGDRLIVVDSKVPDLDFLAAQDSADPTQRAAALAAHAAKLRNTIRALADRDYPRQFPNALDHVVLFLPAESLFSAALEADQELLVWAASRRILLATPASLIALLRSVSVSWQQHAQTENARAIAEAAAELFARVCRFTDHLEKIRSGLERAGGAFNDAVGSFDRMVRPSGERLLRLSGGSEHRSLAVLPPLEQPLRVPLPAHEASAPSPPTSTSDQSAV